MTVIIAIDGEPFGLLGAIEARWVIAKLRRAEPLSTWQGPMQEDIDFPTASAAATAIEHALQTGALIADLNVHEADCVRFELYDAEDRRPRLAGLRVALNLELGYGHPDRPNPDQ